MEYEIKDLANKISKEDDVTILEFSGPINIHTSMAAEVCINQIIDDGAIKLIIDLAGSLFVSSSGLRSFLSCSKKMKSKNIPLTFCNLNHTVKEVFLFRVLTLLSM